MKSRALTLVAVALVAVSCGGGKAPASGPEQSPPTQKLVAVTGAYFATDVDAHCSSYTDLVGEKTIVFKDATSKIIGTATTGKLINVENVVGGHASPIPGTYGACREWADYKVQLPSVDFYQADVNGQVVGTISRQDIESKGRFDLETPPAA